MRTLLLFLLLSSPSLAKPLVITSFSILGDMVREIGQDKVEVKNLVSPNQDSHIFEPRPQDAKELGRADLVIVNGLGFEGWLERLIDASGFRGKVLVAAENISPLLHIRNGTTITDPHAWHSLQNACVYVDNIVRGLSSLLPKEAAFFNARGIAYKKSLQTLEKEARLALAAIPIDKRKVMTGHAAFGYLGREFGIAFYSPVGMSTEAEPSAKAVATLIRKTRQENIQAIFIENILNPRLVEQIARETDTHVGGVLYSDALSPLGTEADTYLKMMTFNLSSLIKGMEGNSTKRYYH
jgi:zinc/manganese transport system substrate-binding protein